MALMVPTAIVGVVIKRLSDLVEEEVVMLWGVQDDLKKLKKKLETMAEVLEDAEEKEFQDKAIHRWLEGVRDAMYDAEDIVDDCIVMHKLNLGKKHKIGKRIKAVNSKIDGVHEERLKLSLVPTVRVQGFVPQTASHKQRPETSQEFIESEIVAIEEDVKLLVQLLMDHRKKSRVFAITGMGGIGKTTLAQKIFHHEKIDTHFKTKIWVCVSQEFVGNELLRRIIRQVGNGSIGEQGSKSELQRDLKQVLGKRPFLLVLDDAWSGRLWEDFLRVPLEGCSKRSKVLVTTRNEDIATAKMDAYHCHKVKLLSPKDGWLLLKKVVYRNREMENTEMLREVGMKIVEQCNGLPLAIKTVGGVLKTKNKSKEAWERVLHSEAWKFSELPDDIMPALLFSYDDMPSHLKQCFLYCSLFPEDFEFSESLIKQMWIAEGFVKEDEGYFEEMADDYFRELVVRSFLHLENHFYNVTIYKMHDMLRALGLYLTRHERFLRELHGLEAASIMPRRLSIIPRFSLDRLEEIPEVVKKQKCLRTLLLFDNPLIKKVQEDVFYKLKRIRVLDLSKSKIETLPDSIKNLIHLKFLNLSSTPLKILPDSVCQLWNLQTLNLRFCWDLKKLPRGISQLSNLRHLDLEFTGVKCLPMIEKLKNLRALHGLMFDVALRDLPRLRSLILYDLENINCGEEAKLAELKNKTHLESVHLSCNSINSGRFYFSEAEEWRRIEEIYEALSLPSSVTSIVIHRFFGRMLPQWTFSSSSSNLSYLQLCDCTNIHCLPMLGQLPHLRILDIQNAKMIKKIGPEFLFGEKANRRRGAFLKLENLYFCDMAEWEEWSYMFDGDDDEEKRMQIMPRLSKLSLQNCPYLKSLPEDLLNHATNLRELNVDRAHSLTSIKNIMSVAELSIRNNDSLLLVSNFTSLGSLKIRHCRALEEVDNIGGSGGLKYLEFIDSGISALPEWFKCMISSTTSSVQARLYLMVSTDFLRQFVPYNGLYWPFIKSFPRVDAESNFFDLYFSYVKNPFHFESNFETGINNDPTSDSDVSEDSGDSEGNGSEDDDHPPPQLESWTRNMSKGFNATPFPLKALAIIISLQEFEYYFLRSCNNASLSEPWGGLWGPQYVTSVFSRSPFRGS